MAKKKFALRADQIKPLAENRGGCIATDMITVQARKVGYMYREQADNDVDSGWRFLSGAESRAYMDNADNHGVYDVNTIANYDPDIIPFFDAPIGTAFERQDGPFVQIQGQPWQPGSKPAKRWPPPGFPLVEGDHDLTATWSIHLPEPFARRIEEGSLVLWRPGLTIWMTAWNNDRGEARAQRLAWIKEEASGDRFADVETTAGGLTRYSYRLREKDDNGCVESLDAFVMHDDGQLQVSIYFDDLADEAKARQLVDSIVRRD